ncbi:MAG TPA: hypothetical protein VMV10_23630 [Pirellulales bacterium]|nr:hypothetical protein [Pirellulales bacterium]
MTAACAKLSSIETLEPPVVAEALPDDGSTVGLLELLLKSERRLNLLLRDPARQREIIPRLLAVALGGFAIYGVAATVVLNAIADKTYWPQFVPMARWSDASAPNLLAAYAIGLIAANGVCLPSFYFYGLLAGVKTTLLGVTAHAMKGMAAGALALVGILPIYVTLALGVVVFPAPRELSTLCVALGLALPFVAGLWGARSLYLGFVSLADTIPCDQRGVRVCFLRRLLLAWCGCYTFVTPVMIYALWNYLAK